MNTCKFYLSESSMYVETIRKVRMYKVVSKYDINK